MDKAMRIVVIVGSLIVAGGETVMSWRMTPLNPQLVHDALTLTALGVAWLAWRHK